MLRTAYEPSCRPKQLRSLRWPTWLEIAGAPSRSGRDAADRGWTATDVERSLANPSNAGRRLADFLGGPQALAPVV